MFLNHVFSSTNGCLWGSFNRRSIGTTIDLLEIYTT